MGQISSTLYEASLIATFLIPLALLGLTAVSALLIAATGLALASARWALESADRILFREEGDAGVTRGPRDRRGSGPRR